MTIGERIKNRREEMGMSQEELAQKLGYKSRSSINKIEMNVYNLKQSKIKALADALETTPAYIMGWEEDSKKEPVQQDRPSELRIRFDEIMSSLTEEQQKDALDVLEIFALKSKKDSQDV